MNSLINFFLVFEAGLKQKFIDIENPKSAFESCRKQGFSDNPADPGGATQSGITLSTYNNWRKSHGFETVSKEILKNIPFQHWNDIFVECFWNAVKASDIVTKQVAYLLVDWVWASGPKIIRNIQRVVGVKADGIFGPQTLAAVNASNQKLLFDRLKKARIVYIEAVCSLKPTLIVFRQGWLNRVNAIRFDKLIFKNPPE